MEVKLTRVLLNSRHTEGSQDLLILFCFVFVTLLFIGGEEWEEHYDVEQRETKASLVQQG